jgi:hypothetical protein
MNNFFARRGNNVVEFFCTPPTADGILFLDEEGNGPFAVSNLSHNEFSSVMFGELAVGDVVQFARVVDVNLEAPRVDHEGNRDD